MDNLALDELQRKLNEHPFAVELRAHKPGDPPLRIPLDYALLLNQVLAASGLSEVTSKELKKIREREFLWSRDMPR